MDPEAKFQSEGHDYRAIYKLYRLARQTEVDKMPLEVLTLKTGQVEIENVYSPQNRLGYFENINVR